MAMLKDEITLLKSASVQIDGDHMLLATYQYHSESGKNGKTDRSKTFYRWLAHVFKIEDLQKWIDELLSDEHRLEKFSWPNDKLKLHLCTSDSTNAAVGEWLDTKLRRCKTWDEGQKQLQGWQTPTARREGKFNPSAKYEIEGYTAENGDTVSLSDRDALLAHVGQNLYKDNV